MGESVTEGTIVEWRKVEGDAVTEGESIADVTTDKVDVEVPAPATGVLRRLLAEAGATVAVGTPIAEIEVGTVARSAEGGGERRAAAAADGGRSAPSTPAPSKPAPSKLVPTRPAGDEAASKTATATPSPPPAQPGRRRPAERGLPEQPPGPGVPVLLPALGESVTEGTVSRWLRQAGDSVTLDEPLVEVTTDKVDVEVPSPVSGTLVEIRVGEGGSVEVGGVLGLVAAAPAPEQPAPEAATGPAPPREAPPPDAPAGT